MAEFVEVPGLLDLYVNIKLANKESNTLWNFMNNQENFPSASGQQKDHVANHCSILTPNLDKEHTDGTKGTCEQLLNGSKTP